MGVHQGLMITSMPQSHFVYWKGKKPAELLGDDAHLVAHLDMLRYQEGRPLTTFGKTGTVLVDDNFDKHSSHRHVYMAEVEGKGNEDPNKLLKQISGDEVTTDSGDANDAERALQIKEPETHHTQKECQHRVQRDLDAEFAVAGEQSFQIPIANIEGVTTILAASQDPATQQALRLA
jgi:hypothetical protein